jgi:hypothetical protein
MRLGKVSLKQRVKQTNDLQRNFDTYKTEALPEPSTSAVTAYPPEELKGIGSWYSYQQVYN